MACTSGSQGPVLGAAAGRSETPTEIAKVINEAMIPIRPTQEIQEIFCKVGSPETSPTKTALTTTNTRLRAVSKQHNR
jgi:hypothetical protein